MTKSNPETLLELLQAWCYNHFTGEQVPLTGNPLSEEPFPHVHSELPLMLLHSISLCPAAGQQRDTCRQVAGDA